MSPNPAKGNSTRIQKFSTTLFLIFNSLLPVVVFMSASIVDASMNWEAGADKIGADFRQTADRIKPEKELARGRFLIAGRRLMDPNFRETVVLLIRYGKTGAMGLVINRPIQVKLSAVIPDIKELEGSKKTLHLGGPVQPNKMLLLMKSAKPPPESMLIFGDVYLSSSREELRRVIKSTNTEEKFRIYAGYAGWAPGQLESECDNGDWHILEANATALFDKKPSEIWPELIHRFTVDWVHLKTYNGSRVQRFNE
ncbi:MAG: YqgE/AlgH family protein [bacterium]|nr:YqgE/AlgH family protein [bacterium]